MNKCKFKPNQHVIAVVNGANVTQGNMYVVNTPYTNASDIPCVSVIGDNGNLAYNYQTVFREAKMVVVESEISVEDAATVVDNKIEDCYVKDDNDWLFVSDNLSLRFNMIKSYKKLCWF